MTAVAYEPSHALPLPGIWVIDQANVRPCGCDCDPAVFGHIHGCSPRNCWTCKCSRCPCGCHRGGDAA